MKLETLADYRDFWSKIPDDKWWVGSLDGPDGAHCALGHCVAAAREAGVLAPHDVAWLTSTGSKNPTDLLYDAGVEMGVAVINDSEHPDYQQSTPKARILAAVDDALASTLPNFQEPR